MKRVSRIAALIWCAFCVFAAAPIVGEAASFARERILLFDAVAVFDPSGTMEVTETITVQAAQNSIRRGIYRVLPLWWDRADTKRFKLEYTVTSVQRDSKDEPFRTTATNDMLTIRVGSADILLPPGRYTYTLTYTVSNHFSRFPEWDELYWNVTGNEWNFPIDKIRFRLLYREGVGKPLQTMPMRSLDVYTGFRDRQGDNFRVVPGGPGLPGSAIETAAPLDRGEGLTIAWTWPREFLANAQAPVPYSLLKKLFIPKGGTVGLWVVPLLLAAYFLLFARRRLQSGLMPEIIPLFTAPENFTPGQLRYAVKRRYDSTSFTADLLHIVAKGAASFSKKEVDGTGAPTLQQGPGFRKTMQCKPLQPGERAAVKGLFSQGDSVAIVKANREVIEKARTSLAGSVIREKDEVLLSVTRYIVLGAAFLLLGPLCAAMLFFPGEGPVIFAFVAVFIGIMATVLVYFTLTVLRNISSFLTFLATLPMVAFLFPFYTALGILCFVIVPLVVADMATPDGYTGVLCACFLIWAVGSATLPRRTAEGQRRYAIAKGLAMYLGTAERSRFAALYPPEESVEHFEELLPYALALDEGKTWANRFQHYLEETGETGDAFADNFSWRDIRDFGSRTSSASVSPLRSRGGGGGFSGSGSSGGGSSGRGSGGGGGGGW